MDTIFRFIFLFMNSIYWIINYGCCHALKSVNIKQVKTLNVDTFSFWRKKHKNTYFKCNKYSNYYFKLLLKLVYQKYKQASIHDNIRCKIFLTLCINIKQASSRQQCLYMCYIYHSKYLSMLSWKTWPNCKEWKQNSCINM